MINGLLVSVIPTHTGKLNWLIMFADKQTHQFHCPLEPGLFEGYLECPLGQVFLYYNPQTGKATPTVGSITN